MRPFQDDEDIIVSDLKDAHQQQDAANEGERISLRSRYTKSQRHRSLLITSAIVLIAVLIIIGSYPPTYQMVMTRLFPTPVAKPLSGSNLFYLPALPPWGKFTLDGKALEQTPTSASEIPIRIPVGEHVLEWRGAPFNPLRCTLFAAATANKDTCKIDRFVNTVYADQAWLIEFPQALSLSTLPEQQRQSLTATTQQLLNTLESSETVQPGEYYSYGLDQPIQQTGRPLQARQSFSLDTDITQTARCAGVKLGPLCNYSGQDCRLFCTLNWPKSDAEPAAKVWHVVATIRQHWQYTALNKENQQSVRPSDQYAGDQYIVLLQIQWEQKRWQVSFHPQQTSSFDDPNCLSLTGILSSDPSYLYSTQMQAHVKWNFSSGEKRASGCLAWATLYHQDVTVPQHTPDTADAYILQRFGVLLTVGERAQRLWPRLPAAPDKVQQIARQISLNSKVIS